MRNCTNCLNGKQVSEKSVYCLLFGIMIRAKHEGCKYHREDEGNDTAGRDGVDDTAGKAAG